MDKSKQLCRKRARLHFSGKKGVRREETGLRAWLRSSNMSFVSRLSQTWAVAAPAVWRLHLPSTNQEEMPCTHKHICTHNHKRRWTALRTHAPASLKTYTHKHTLKRSKEMKTAGQGGVRLASSANLLFLHLSRSPGIITHILDIALQFPPWREKKKRLSAFVCCGYVQVDPCAATLW